MKTWQGIAKADQFHSFLPSSMSLFEFCNLSKILLCVTKDCYSLYHVHCTYTGITAEYELWTKSGL